MCYFRGMITWLDKLDEVEPVERPLKRADDELLAEYLSQFRCYRKVARETKNKKKKFAAHSISRIINGPFKTKADEERSTLIRGRIAYKITEMMQELEASKHELVSESVRVYVEVLKNSKKEPKLALAAARDVLQGLAYFNPKEESDNKGNGPNLQDRDKLEQKAARILKRKKKNGK